MTKGFSIELEDNGQDFLEFITDQEGHILEAKPFQTEVWKNGYIPIESQEIGEQCMMHKPPHIIYGHLKHKVLKITPLNNDSN
jgi:hypothetical protein